MVRGPIVMLGYYGNEAATAATIEPDGWLHTGDIAVVDEDGRFFIVDRRKDMIITGGYNVYPPRSSGSSPAILPWRWSPSAARPMPVKGELARAYVVLRAGRRGHRGGDHRALPRRTWPPTSCRARSASWPTCPKTSTGKIMRRELRKLD